MTSETQRKPQAGASRRTVLSSAGAASVFIAAAPRTPAQGATVAEHLPAAPAGAHGAQAIAGEVPVRLKINGRDHDLHLDPRTTLLDCLREHVDLTGTKKGCDHGQCGACTVHVGGRRINACLTFAVMHDGEEITTVEGLGQPGALHPMQAAFVRTDGYQCGYCTSGQIMSAVAILEEPIGDSDAELREAMSGNICRCGAYQNIVEAIQSVRAKSPARKAA